jgi:hypothetical protein
MDDNGDKKRTWWVGLLLAILRAVVEILPKLVTTVAVAIRNRIALLCLFVVLLVAHDEVFRMCNPIREIEMAKVTAYRQVATGRLGDVTIAVEAVDGKAVEAFNLQGKDLETALARIDVAAGLVKPLQKGAKK